MVLCGNPSCVSGLFKTVISLLVAKQEIGDSSVLFTRHKLPFSPLYYFFFFPLREFVNTRILRFGAREELGFGMECQILIINNGHSS